ncbi:hypothetical protein NL506_27845, partial [Klebsiella pneumoniae]|nr:hypothetical protein [Klebsiella pneumoniae]
MVGVPVVDPGALVSHALVVTAHHPHLSAGNQHQRKPRPGEGQPARSPLHHAESDVESGIHVP